MKRFFDILFSLTGIFLLFPVLIILFILGYIKNRSPLFKQNRVGLNQKIFTLLKFRTMPLNTKSMATHLMKDLKLSSYSNFLRKSKLDEIPQLLNVLVGDMSLVGPRPCLANQTLLINERKKRNIFSVKPGITGLAQIYEIDMETPILLARIEAKMINNMSIYFYFYCLIRTLLLILKK